MFSYDQYLQIIEWIKEKGNLCSFKEAIGKQEFTIMRHDVEFSVERAFQLAEFENRYNFNSTYFFQLTNNTYNLLSKKNIDLVKEIHKMGNVVGLHFHMNGMDDIRKIQARIETEMDILGYYLQEKIDEFSIHRPDPFILEKNLKSNHFINAYQDDFFSFVPDMDKDKPKITYISDARHRWNYGLIPNRELFLSNKKIQILTHPYSWTIRGYANLENFRTLLEEKNQELINSIDAECKHFAEVKDEL